MLKTKWNIEIKMMYNIYEILFSHSNEEFQCSSVTFSKSITEKYYLGKKLVSLFPQF